MKHKRGTWIVSMALIVCACAMVAGAIAWPTASNDAARTAGTSTAAGSQSLSSEAGKTAGELLKQGDATIAATVNGEAILREDVLLKQNMMELQKNQVIENLQTLKSQGGIRQAEYEEAMQTYQVQKTDESSALGELIRYSTVVQAAQRSGMEVTLEEAREWLWKNHQHTQQQIQDASEEDRPGIQANQDAFDSFVAGMGYTLDEYYNEVMPPSTRQMMMYNRYKLAYTKKLPEEEREDYATQEQSFEKHVDELVANSQIVYNTEKATP